MEKIILEDGKYEIRLHNNGGFECFRNRREWRDLVGDKLILSLVTEIQIMKKGWDDIKNNLNRYIKSDYRLDFKQEFEEYFNGVTIETEVE